MTIPDNTPLLPISRAIFQVMFHFLGGIRCSGADNVPPTGGALLCPNHISDFDPLAVLAATRRNDLNALAKHDLFEIAVIGEYLRAVGAIPVVRDSADRAALRQSEAILKAGRLMLIFPEGRCSPSGKLQTVQAGAVLLSRRTGVPIIPIGIRGTNRVLPYGSTVPRFAGGGVTVNVGRRISPRSYSALCHHDALHRMTRDLRMELARLTYQQ